MLPGSSLTATAAGALAGFLIVGPIGAVAGGVIAAASANTAAKKIVRQAGLLSELWRGLVVTKEIFEKLPVIGLVRLDRGGAPLPTRVCRVMRGQKTAGRQHIR